MAAKFDIKKAAINHVEKAVFAVILLIVLMSLAGTKWSRYQGTPGEILEKIQQGRTNLVNHDWPEEEMKLYTITPENSLEKDPQSFVEQTLFANVDIAQYEFSNKFLRILGADREPIREPDLVAPESPIVSSGRVFIRLAADPTAESTESEELAAAEPMPEEPEQNVPDEFLKRDPALTAGAGMGYPGGGEGEFYAPELANMYDDPEMYSGGYEDAGYPGEYPGAGLYGGEEGMMMQTVKLNGQGFHYAAVRAVFNYRDQIRKFADAIHRSYHEAATLFQIIDFELERQTRLAGDDPWSGPWEKVDIKVAKDVLEKCDGFDADIVNSMVTDAVITMPLPARITGMWRRDATHPRIANYELSPEEMKLEMELNSKLLKEFIDQKRKERESVVQRGGFATTVFDVRSVQSGLLGMESAYESMGSYGGESGYGGEYGAGYGASYGGMTGAARPGTAAKDDPAAKLMALIKEGVESGNADTKKQEEALRAWIKKRATASSDLLLFRYFDFSVEPGKTYRYRVRLVLNNPNFGRRVADAGGLAHVVEGPTRTTDWSEVSPPVSVAPSMTYFLTNVREPRSYRFVPSAVVDAFQYDPSFGTFVNHSVEVVPGQKIGGEATTTIYKPAESKIEPSERYTFTSNDVLVDTMGDFQIDPDFHGGEKVDPATRLKLLPGRKLPLPNFALVEQGDEGLELLDGSSRKDQHEKWIDFMASQQKQFEDLKKRAEMLATAGEGGEYGGLYGGEGMSGYSGYEGGMDEMMMMGGERGRNVMRKGTVPRTSSGRFIRRGGMSGEGS